MIYMCVIVTPCLDMIGIVSGSGTGRTTDMPCPICDSPIDFDEDFCYYCDTKYNCEPFDLWDHAMVDTEWEEM